ncbi:dienelactone hydrolase [Marinomonas sp. THO17]|uniref:alpha/beta hydrolase family protein n=1 Tax=Marinomonas sp. THO17 TaxID=3149048 RepID=UPI00336BC77E
MKIHKLVTLFCAILVGSSGVVLANEYRLVGLQNVEVYSPSRQEKVSIKVWYPSASVGKPTLLESSRIFKGSLVLKEGRVAPGHYPLVIMSHGSGANNDSMAWLAIALSRSGFIVAAPNHPGSSTGDSTPVDTPKLWQRTDDLALVMTFLTETWSARHNLDTTKIGVLGFSLGGAAAMSLVGAKVHLDKYVDYCDKYPSMADCHWFDSLIGYVDGKQVAMAPFDLRLTDKRKFEQSNLDDRVRAAVLVDPSMALAFEMNQLRHIDVPMHFINLGHPNKVPVSVDASLLASSVSNGQLNNVLEATHFSFLPECKKGAKAFLEAIGEEDRLCDEVGIRSREDLHTELIYLIRRAFKRSLL